MGDRLATIDTGQKLGAVPLLGELGPHLTQCGLGRGILIHPAVWPQQTCTENWGRAVTPFLGVCIGMTRNSLPNKYFIG